MSARIHDEAPFALSWTMDEAMARTSHALVHDGRVWLVDPVLDEEALARVAALGEPAGVLQLLDRHARDGNAIARHLRVPLVPIPGILGGTPFEVVPLVDRRWWHETALWWPARRTLVVPEAVGSAPVFRLGDGPIGVHPVLRMTPPERLREYDPAHLLMGHGAPLHEDAAAGLRDALDRSRRDIPRGLLRLPRAALRRG